MNGHNGGDILRRVHLGNPLLLVRGSYLLVSDMARGVVPYKRKRPRAYARDLGRIVERSLSPE
jgi:hypothetical protein